MKEKICRKVISGIIMVALLLSLVQPIPVAAAKTPEIYSYEGYEIQYLVANEWENGQTVEITVTNTGDESIFNWAFKYDAKGEINNIWNAGIVEQNGTEYVVRNENHNFEIAPGKSVSFGYTLTEFNPDQPNEFELCSKRTQMESGYEVKMLVSDSWDMGFKGEVVIKNTSKQPLEAWDLSFDTNFVIDNLWDARIIENTDNHYKIASEMWTNPILAGDEVKIGFVATKSEEAEAFVDGVMLTSVLIDYDFNSNPNPAPEPEPVVKGSIDLSTDESEIPTDSGSKTVYFYARTEIEVPSITLFNKDTSQSIGILVDDGNFSTSGDDIKGDGVYTCKAEIDISKEKEYTFYAQYADIVSESVEISVFEGFTDQENGEMDEVDAVLADWLSSEDFQQLSLEEKEKQGLSILNSLAQEGTEDYPYELIQEDTIYYDSVVHGYFFTYSCGALGNVMLVECECENRGEDGEYISI